MNWIWPWFNAEHLIASSYYTMPNVNNILNNAGSNSLSLFGCNVRSLPKNLISSMLWPISLPSSTAQVSSDSHQGEREFLTLQYNLFECIVVTHQELPLYYSNGLPTDLFDFLDSWLWWTLRLNIYSLIVESAWSCRTLLKEISVIFQFHQMYSFDFSHF